MQRQQCGSRQGNRVRATEVVGRTAVSEVRCLVALQLLPTWHCAMAWAM
jgi:hypothetical protein